MAAILAVKLLHSVQPSKRFDGVSSEQTDQRMTYFGQFFLWQEKGMTAVTGILCQATAFGDDVDVMSTQATARLDELAEMIFAGIRRDTNGKEHRVTAAFANILTMTISFANLFVRMAFQQTRQVMPNVYC